MFKKRFFLLLIVSIALSACGTLEVSLDQTQTPAVDANQVATIVAATLAAMPSSTPIPTDTLSPTLTDTPTVAAWAWHTIDLYHLEIQLPGGWMIDETNRHPIPTGLGYPTPEHDCAEYSISNPDGTVKIFLKPECQYFEANPFDCPAKVTLMSRDSITGVRYDNLPGDGLIGRYFDNKKSVYFYSIIDYPTMGGQVKMMCYTEDTDGTILVGKEGQRPDFIHAGFQYFGSDADLEKLFITIDKIILSIRKS